jgi:hypothetical protein
MPPKKYGLNFGQRMTSMTDVELSKLLSDLEQTAKKLNDASSRINNIILSCENKIRSSNLGIEAWLKERVDLSDETEFESPDTPKCKTAFLGFAKVENNWCLAARFETDVTAFAVVPLLQAPRKVRTGAVELLPDLVLELSQRAAARLAAIEKAEKLVS